VTRRLLLFGPLVTVTLLNIKVDANIINGQWRILRAASSGSQGDHQQPRFLVFWSPMMFFLALFVVVQHFGII